MAQTKNVSEGQEFDCGPVSGTLAGVPAPLPGPVSFALDGALPSVSLVQVDPVTVTVKCPVGSAGTTVLTVSSGSLSDTVGIVIAAVPPPVADQLVVPLSDPRPLA